MPRLPKGLNPNEFTKKDQRWNSDSLSPEIFNASANLEGPGMGGWTTHVTKCCKLTVNNTSVLPLGLLSCIGAGWDAVA